MPPEIFARRVETPPSPALLAGLVTFPVSSPLPWTNFLSRTEAHVASAASRGASLVMFPELTVLAVTSDGATLAELAQSRAEEYFLFHQALARRYGIHLLAGSFPRVIAPGHIVNTAALCSPDGTLVLQDKLHLTPDEEAWGWSPGRDLKLVTGPWGRLAILICYDSQFPALSEQLVSLRPDLLLVPSMTDVHGFARVNVAAQARAVEHHAYVLTVGVVGQDAHDTLTVGQAHVYTPRAEGFPGILASSAFQTEGVEIVRLDLDLLRQSQASTGIFAARAERERRSVETSRSSTESTSHPRN